MFHSNLYFHFALVDIPSKHSCSPLENNTFWKITQMAIHTQNQQFVLPNSPFDENILMCPSIWQLAAKE
jgi:hypothetical protein